MTYNTSLYFKMKSKIQSVHQLLTVKQLQKNERYTNFDKKIAIIRFIKKLNNGKFQKRPRAYLNSLSYLKQKTERMFFKARNKLKVKEAKTNISSFFIKNIKLEKSL